MEIDLWEKGSGVSVEMELAGYDFLYTVERREKGRLNKAGNGKHESHFTVHIFFPFFSKPDN